MPVSILRDKQTNAWFFLKRQSEAKEHFRQLIQKGCFLKNEKLLLSFVVRKSETRNFFGTCLLVGSWVVTVLV